MANFKLIFLALLSIIHSIAGASIAERRDIINIRDANPTQSTPRAVPFWQFYFGVDAATHQTNFVKWSQADYRLISLSVYGTPPNVRYAAVWVQLPGPAYVAIHNAHGAEYQAWFDKYSAQGYVSTIVTATGPIDSAIYAGVMEKIPDVSAWIQLCGITGPEYQESGLAAAANNLILKSFREYGTPNDRRYCALWHANPTNQLWDYWFTQTYAEYQNTFNNEVAKPNWRPTYVTLSDDQYVSSLFVETDVGGQWLARHGLTGPELLTEYQTQAANGLYITNLQGGGSGSDTRFAAIWST